MAPQGVIDFYTAMQKQLMELFQAKGEDADPLISSLITEGLALQAKTQEDLGGGGRSGS